MPGTVIDLVNILGKDQPEHLNFNYGKGQLIGEVELTGEYGEPSETPHQIEIVQDNDLDQ